MNKGLIAYFAQNRTAAKLLTLFVLVSGTIAAVQLPVQLYPQIDLRRITVIVPFPGATPKEVEQDINRRVEESIIGLSGVERVVTNATANTGVITIRLTPFADEDAVLSSVENAVDSIDRFPPPKAERPTIQIEKLKLEVLTLSVSSETASEHELRSVAEDIQNDLLNLKSVSHVDLEGVRDREIAIELDEEQLRRNDLTFSQIARKIKRNSANLTFGELKTESGTIVLSSNEKRSAGDEYRDIPLITDPNGSLITLGDVAVIRDAFSDQDVVSRLNGKPAIFVRVGYDEDQSITEIAERVRQWLGSKIFPAHIDVEVWNDKAAPSLERVREIISSGLFGLVLVFLCLIAVFDLRVATWITVGIPISFIGAFLFFDIAALTLNVGTIFAFFLLVGIVVDDAVVVGESIAAERQRGKNALDAAISGTKAVAAPITIGVITTLLAFTPLLFVTSERFQIFKVIPVVGFFVLLVSLIEAFLILPAHLSHEKPWSLAPLRNIQERTSSWLDSLRDKVVSPIVIWSTNHIILTPVIGLIIVVAACLLLTTGAVRIIIGDQLRNVSDSILAEITHTAGTPFDATLAAAEKFAEAAEQANEELGGNAVKSISLIAGLPSTKIKTTGDFVRSSAANQAAVRVHLNDQDVRDVSVPLFERTWRHKIENISSFQRVEFQSARTLTRPSISYSLLFNDRKILQSAVADFKAMLSKEPGIYDLNDNMSLGNRQFEIELTDAGKLAGLTLTSLGAQLRANYHGLEVQRIQRGHDEIKVMLRYPEHQRQNLSDLANVRIRIGNGREMPLPVAARITEKRELSKLTRINGEVAALINGYADETVATPIQIRRKINETHIPKLLREYPGLTIDIDGSAREEASMIKVLAVMTPLVLLAMYVLVATFLRSYWKPLVVVFGFPVAFAGAVASHLILGWDFTGMSMMGIIAVLGVIVNDALVLLDRYNKIRRADVNLPAIAIASAAMHHRFRAVFLTSLTTVLGLSPLLYVRSEELLSFIPFVVSMLGGLIFASLFTLFMLPALVMLIEGRRE